MRYLKAFGRFWWDFLVGDTPELFIATVLLVGLAYALHRVRAAAVPILILAAICCLGASAWRGRRRKAPGPGVAVVAEEADPAGNP